MDPARPILISDTLACTRKVVGTNITFGDPEAMLKRKAEDRRKFLELPAAEAQRRIHIHTEGLPLNAHEEDPLFTTDLTGDGILD